MNRFTSNRYRERMVALASAVFCACTCVPAQSQDQGYKERSTPAPIERREPSAQMNSQQPAKRPGSLPNGQHLREWFDQHRNQTPEQKLQALEREPGFHDLPPQTQQHMRDRLIQLGNMTPEQRSRIMTQTEALERLSPEQRGQIRSAMQQLANLPPASRYVVSHTFRAVRGMPPEQRLAYLNTPGVGSQLSPPERDTLRRLMAIEPLLPPPSPRPEPMR